MKEGTKMKNHGSTVAKEVRKSVSIPEKTSLPCVGQAVFSQAFALVLVIETTYRKKLTQ